LTLLCLCITRWCIWRGWWGRGVVWWRWPTYQCCSFTGTYRYSGQSLVLVNTLLQQKLCVCVLLLQRSFCL